MITKYTGNEAPDGYNFVIVENKSSDQKFEEKMEYSTFEGLKIIGDETSKNYDLTVGPNDTQIVIMEAGFAGYGT